METDKNLDMSEIDAIVPQDPNDAMPEQEPVFWAEDMTGFRWTGPKALTISEIGAALRAVGIRLI